MSSTGTRLPNLLIVGATKAGTTSLFSYLVQHPDVCGSRVKETEYFSDLVYPDGRLASLSTYERNFRHCREQRYLMEATPNYWYGGEATRSALEKVLDHPRYLFALRNPVDRFWSDFTYMRSKRLLPDELTAEAFLDECITAHDSRIEFTRERRRYRTLSTGFYADHVPAWMDAFGDRVHIVFFEQLAPSPEAVVADVCRWLDIDPAPLRTMDFSSQNPTITHRNALLQRLAYGAGQRGDRLLRRFPRLKSALTSGYYAVNRSGTRTESIDPALEARLAAIYERPNRELARELERRGVADLPDWMSG